MLARAWRFARIVHGVGVSVHDVDEHEMNDEETYLEEKAEIVEEYFPGSSPKLDPTKKDHHHHGKEEKKEEKKEEHEKKDKETKKIGEEVKKE